jgi:hypothetical protein
MAIKKKSPTLADILQPYGFSMEQVKTVWRGINVVTSYRQTQKILEGLSTTEIKNMAKETLGTEFVADEERAILKEFFSNIREATDFCAYMDQNSDPDHYEGLLGGIRDLIEDTEAQLERIKEVGDGG